jgi:hypothetical protein
LYMNEYKNDFLAITRANENEMMETEGTARGVTYMYLFA